LRPDFPENPFGSLFPPSSSTELELAFKLNDEEADEKRRSSCFKTKREEGKSCDEMYMV